MEGEEGKGKRERRGGRGERETREERRKKREEKRREKKRGEERGSRKRTYYVAKSPLGTRSRGKGNRREKRGD